MTEGDETETNFAPGYAPHRRLSLLVMGGRGVFTYPLPSDGALRIGRAKDCEIHVDDTQISREHARILVSSTLAIVDLGSHNGTQVDARPLTPNEPTPLLPGSIVTMGATVLVVQNAGAEARTRQLWSHGYFETRLEEECARAAQRKSTFAVMRVRFDATPSEFVESCLSASMSPEHVVACYSPGQYEVLLTDTGPEDAAQVAKALEGRLTFEGTPPQITVTCYGRDGRTPEALMAGLSPSHDGAEAPELPAEGAIERLRTVAERFASGTIPVLVLGETGVGKEVLASTIHRLSPRAAKPYVCINCGALPVTLFESALFGHERGAFTGATAAKAGLLESANGGTVFLDEVGEIPLVAQAALLRVLDQGEVLRVGATRPRPLDVRFIAATNRDLEHEVELGRFRQDLYFRLAAATIVIPPLRDRVAEIGPLARVFVRQTCRELGRVRIQRVLPEALAVLEHHSWPGNVRELSNVMERAVLLAGEADIEPAHLPQEKMGGRRLPTQEPTRRPPQGSGMASFWSDPPLPSNVGAKSLPSFDTEAKIAVADVGAIDFEAKSEVPGERLPSARPLHMSARLPEALARDPEVARLLAVLEACDWNQSVAAQKLGISRRTLVSRLSAYGLTRKRSR